MSAKKIYIIAGEASGDNIGAKLITQLKNISKFPLEFYGVGGKKMQEVGLQSLFPMEEISIIGFIEAIPHIPNIFRRLKQTFEDIKKIQPDCIITIDSPGFNKRLAKKLCEQLPNIKRIHYVAPTVWAYKPQRAKQMAELFNHLFVLLPFEPPYFEAENLPTTFTGHPIFEDFTSIEAEQVTKSDNQIALLVGSRKGEIKRLLPIYLKAIEMLKKYNSNYIFNFLVSESFKNEITKKTKHLTNINIITEESQRRIKLKEAAAAIVKSGTVSLEVAMCKTPMVITYKVSKFSAYMLRKMIKIKYVTLLNIVSDKEIIPELLQENCTAENIANSINDIITDKQKSNKQLSETALALTKLGFDAGQVPSRIAAEMVLNLIA